MNCPAHKENSHAARSPNIPLPETATHSGFAMTRRIVVALDDSRAAEQAVQTASEIARRSAGRLSLLHVVCAPVRNGTRVASAAGVTVLEENTSSEARVRRRLQRAGPSSAELAVAYGVPSVEICRFAEEQDAYLVVLGRKQHPERIRLLLGDTTDGVARRSRVPALFVPHTGTGLRRMLVALDGSERAMQVLERACDFARAVGAVLHVITVEGTCECEPGRKEPPLARSAALQNRVSSTLSREHLPDVAVTIRRGRITDEVLKEVEAGGYDVLVIGHHRGGPGWLVQSGSTAQQLGHAAPCAVLTVPL